LRCRLSVRSAAGSRRKSGLLGPGRSSARSGACQTWAGRRAVYQTGMGRTLLNQNSEPVFSGPQSQPPGSRDDGRPTRIVRYGAMGYVGEFTHKPGLTIPCGSKVVVQTERGIELGEPIGVVGDFSGCEPGLARAQVQTYLTNSGPEFCRPYAGRILRVASEQDVNEHKRLNAHIAEDVADCAELAEKLGLEIKIVTAEHLLGGERIVFYFGAPGRVDFRQLVRELAQRYRTRIEMRQVGARDEARLVADYEVCGRECCCKNFLKKLRPVNMKMAKLQKSTLDPTKVSGRCGRLRCCLRFEHVGYEELAARLPKVGSRVGTDFGTGTVLDRQVLTQLVSVRIDGEERTVVISREEIRAVDLPPAPRPVAPPPDGDAAFQPAASATPQPRSRRRGRGKRGASQPGVGAGQASPRPGGFEAGVEPQPVEASKFEPTEGSPEAFPEASPAPSDVESVPPLDRQPPPDAGPAVPPETRSRRRRRGRRRGKRGKREQAGGGARGSASGQ